MEHSKDEQDNNPSQPNSSHPAPHHPTSEESKKIHDGAENEDQLNKLKPQDEQDKAANQIGSPPITDVSTGD